MYDLFEYPNISGGTVQEIATQVNNYLVQFKETLEFALTNIGADNLSVDLAVKLNELGADIVQNKVEQNESFQQVAGRALTVSDVINSASYKASIEQVEAPLPLCLPC